MRSFTHGRVGQAFFKRRYVASDRLSEAACQLLSVDRLIAIFDIAYTLTYPASNGQLLPIEKYTVAIFNALKSQNIPLLGLSDQSKETSDATLRQLKELEIEFSANHFGLQPIVLNVNNAKITENAPGYCGGILFCAGESESLCLEAFRKSEPAQKIFSEKKEILYVGCNEKKCERMEAYLMKAGFRTEVVHYLGWRYTSGLTATWQRLAIT